MSKQKINHGDIFAVPLPDGTYLFGRVMLDVYSMLKRRLLPADSSLPGLGKALLIEMYERVHKTLNYEPSAVLVPGAFIESDNVGNDWPIIANVPIDTHDVQFPESMVIQIHDAGHVAFLCGEIQLPIPIKERELDNMKVSLTRHSAYLWSYYCLKELGRATEVPEKYRSSCRLSKSDLRFSKHRKKVYRYLPIKPGDSYYEQQKQLGLELDRLYKVK